MNIPKPLKILGAFMAGIIVICSMGAVFDPQGREMINISGSTNILVSVTNSITSSVGNTVALPVSNSISNPYLWISATNSTANVGNMGVTNSAGTYLWTAQTNAIPTGANVIGAVTQSGTWTVQPGNTPNTVGWLVNVTNSPSISQIGTNSGGTYIWTAQTNAIPTGANVIGGVTQSAGWSVAATNAAGGYIWTAQTNSIPTGANVIGAVTQSGTWNIGSITTFPDNEPFNVAQVGGFATGSALPVTNVPSAVYWSTLTNSTANVGNIGATNSAGTYLWVATTNLTQVGQHNVAVIATNANGYTPFMQVSAATINTNTWKGSACTLGFLTAFNSNASPRYICILDSATNRSPAEGSTSVLVQKYMIPGNTAGAGFVISLPPQGIKLVNGLCTATVTGMATNDANAVAASEILLNGAYK